MAGTIQKALLNDGVVIRFITLKMGGPNALVEDWGSRIDGHSWALGCETEATSRQLQP